MQAWLPRRLSKALNTTLPLCILGTLLFLVLDLQAGAWLARIALLLYLLVQWPRQTRMAKGIRSEEHTSELQSRSDLVCRLLLEKKKQKKKKKKQQQKS